MNLWKDLLKIALLCCFLSGMIGLSQAQKKFSKTYPADKNVRLQLINRTGTVTVEGWDKNFVQITADLESPAASIFPQNLSGTILINVVRDNQGKDEVGSVNFHVKIPHDASVSIETLIGNLNVSNISGGLVRAHITSEGDIRLINISALSVSAENVMGDIFFDGDIKAGGVYRFSSVRGNITLRIPFESSFRVVATAPSTRDISVGPLLDFGLKFISEGRRVVGQLGNGDATINVTNQRGRIVFLKR
ncbi:MAG: hypothetical protein N2Z23_05145 [Pyrinomonadaceae bacterium]|nr:hypothetical protein [Pyrinomonadaceae bacterium]MCX7639811.1 hypothetical protein [Pyrinomonadaceae bacterium]MDW8304394.1 hypothetical protein [Acidobacteriota bacterium]